MRDKGLMQHGSLILLARAGLALLFIFTGAGKLAAGPEIFANQVAALGLPVPIVFAWATILVEVLGGLAVLAGFHTRAAACVLAGFCIGTAFIAHFDFSDPSQMNQFLKNLGLAAGFLLLATTGPGSVSVDESRRLGEDHGTPASGRPI